MPLDGVAFFLALGVLIGLLIGGGFDIYYHHSGGRR